MFVHWWANRLWNRIKRLETNLYIYRNDIKQFYYMSLGKDGIFNKLGRKMEIASLTKSSNHHYHGRLNINVKKKL